MKSNQQKGEVIREFVKNFFGFKRGDYVKYKYFRGRNWTYGVIVNCRRTNDGTWDFLIKKRNGKLRFIWEEAYEVKLAIRRKRKNGKDKKTNPRRS